MQWLVSLAVLTEIVAICLGNRELSAFAGGIFVVAAFLMGAGRLQVLTLSLSIATLFCNAE